MKNHNKKEKKKLTYHKRIFHRMCNSLWLIGTLNKNPGKFFFFHTMKCKRMNMTSKEKNVRLSFPEQLSDITCPYKILI